MDGQKQPIPILIFADSVVGVRPYDWQSKILLSFKSGNQTAAACCNNAGKTSTIFPVAALWTLFSFPKARIVYLSATHEQVKEQFFVQPFSRFRLHQAFAGWTWNETELRTAQGGYITGRSTDTSGNIEGYHARSGSPVAILVDVAKSVSEEIFEALSRCTATFRLYASSTGPSFGFFHSLFTSRSAYWRNYRIRSTDCPHIPQSHIDADREADGEHSSTFRIKHLSEFLYDSGKSVISLETFEPC
jgi:hypothetical protein